jgi:hypothetical protein
VRLRPVLASVALLAVGLAGAGPMAGCAHQAVTGGRTASDGGRASGGGPPDTTVTPTRFPAAIAGGACQLLDYTVIKAAIDIDFNVAAASESAGTASCVLERVGASLPDLALSVTPSKVSVDVFASTVTPSGAKTASGLGKRAYWVPVAAADSAGPGIEVGWLSANQRLMMLRLRTPTGTAAGDLTPLAPKLVALAKTIDKATS